MRNGQLMACCVRLSAALIDVGQCLLLCQKLQMQQLIPGFIKLQILISILCSFPSLQTTMSLIELFIKQP